MRVLIVFHGRLPGGPYPVPGIAVRAFGNGLGLEACGVEVFYASRRRDLSGPPVPGLPPVHPFEGKQELVSLVKMLAPDLVLVEGTYDVAFLADLDLPIAVDLFAPRVLEAQWEDVDVSAEMLSLMDALSRADYFLVTTERQKHFYLGAMTLSGVDCREERIAVVPIAAVADLEEVPMAEEPLLVSGGVVWPWQDPTWALQHVAARLDAEARGALHLLRGIYPLQPGTGTIPRPPVAPSPRVVVHELLDHPDMCHLVARAWCVVDVTARNLEREMALSFRQVDALACGTPLLIADHQPLAPWVAEYDAGWVIPFGDDARLDAALDDVFGKPELVSTRSANARRLAVERLAPERAVLAFAGMVRAPSRRTPRTTLVTALARRSREADELASELAEARRQLRDLSTDIDKKDQEISALTTQVHDLMNAVGRLSSALDVLTHGREQAAWLAAEREETLQADRVSLERALAAVRQDVAKKTHELEKSIAQRETLEADLSRLDDQVRVLQQKLEQAREDAVHWRSRCGVAEEQTAALRTEVRALRDDVAKKQDEIRALWETRDQLAADVDDMAARLAAADAAMVAAEARARQRIDHLEAALQAQKEASSVWKSRFEEVHHALDAARRDLEALARVRGVARVLRIVENAVQRTRGRSR